MNNNSLGFNLRVKYQKLGKLRFLSHLELIKTMERTIRRAGLPYAVSQGFNKRIRASFSNALPVGTASLDEYFDVLLTEFVDTEKALDALKKASLKKLPICEAHYVDPRAESLVASLTHADYEAYIPHAKNEFDDFNQALNSLLECNYIVRINKKGKKKKLILSEKLLEKPMIEIFQDGLVVSFTTISSNTGSLRPDVFFENIISFTKNNKEMDVRSIDFVKLSQYACDNNGNFIDAWKNQRK